MEEPKNNTGQWIWEARLVLPFMKNTLKVNILVVAENGEEAKEKAIEWAHKYVDTNRKWLSDKLGYGAYIKEVPCRVFKTSYCAFV
jgi:hypothetical protein